MHSSMQLKNFLVRSTRISILQSPSLAPLLQFDPVPPLIIAEWFRFHRRNQGRESQYMAELWRLADRCEFGASLQSQAIQRRLLTEEKLTLEKTCGTAHGLEEAQQQATKLQTSANVTADRNLYVGRGQTPTDVEPAKTPNPPCYRCGKIGYSPERASASVRNVGLARNTDT